MITTKHTAKHGVYVEYDNIKDLLANIKVGQKVRCKLDGSDVMDGRDWFDGTVHSLSGNNNYGRSRAMSIKRDDGVNGVGIDHTWNIAPHEQNYMFLQIYEERDWDE